MWWRPSTVPNGAWGARLHRRAKHCGEVGGWTFPSSVLFQPRFPPAFEHEYVGELRLLAETTGNFPAGVAAQATAIDDDFFTGRPYGQKLRQQFVPPVFVQRNRAGDVIARKLFVRPRINPNRSVAPSMGLIDSHHLPGRNGGAPRNLVAKIDRLASGRKKRQCCYYRSLAYQEKFQCV